MYIHIRGQGELSCRGSPWCNQDLKTKKLTTQALFMLEPLSVLRLLCVGKGGYR